MSYNSALGACRQQWPLALQLFATANGQRLADAVTHSGCISALEWRKGLELLIPELSAVNAGAAVCAGLRSATALEDVREWRASNWPWSLQVLRSCGLRLDLVSFNTYLGATADWQKALCLLGGLEEASLQADRITCSHLRLPWSRCLGIGLKAAMSEPSWQLSLATMSHRAVLRACAASATWRRALAIFNYSEASQLEFLAVVNACARGKQQAMVEMLLESMEKCKVRKSVELFTAAMGAADIEWGSEWRGQDGWQWCLELLSSMHVLQLEVDSMVMGVALSVCLRSECWEVAIELAPRLPFESFCSMLPCKRGPSASYTRYTKVSHGPSRRDH